MQVFQDAQGRLRNGWRILGFLVLFLFAALVAGLLAHLRPRALQAYLPGQWFTALAVLAATWIALVVEGDSWASLGLRLDRRFAGDLLLGTLGGTAILLAAAGLVAATGGVRWHLTPDLSPAFLLREAWFYLGVAVMEEALFRGYPFQRAVQGLGFGWAQAAFAAGFALVHWGNPGMAGATRGWASLNIALAALLLGLCWRRTGSLALPIGVHLGWNWTQGSLLGFGVSGVASRGWWTPEFQGRPAWWTGGAFGPEAGLACTVACGAAILLLARWRGRVSGGASTASGS